MTKNLLIILFSITSLLSAQEGLIRTYHPNGNLESEINYLRNVREGEAKFYYETGKIREERNYTNGKVDGLVKIYYENGKLREMYNIEDGKREGPTTLFNESGEYLSDIFYEAGMLYVESPVYTTEPEKTDFAVNDDEQVNEKAPVKKEVKRRTSDDTGLPPAQIDEKESDPAYYLTAEIMPEPVGGMAVIYKKLVYPEEARKKKIEGIVKVSAFIDESGDVTKAEVVEGIGYGCDESARIAVYYTRFRPGQIRGKPVKMQIIVPVEFKIF